MKRLQKMILPGAVLLVCLLALIGWKAYSNRVGKTQTIATVIQNGEVVYTFDLANVTETQEFTLGEPGKQNVIQVSPQGIGVIHADCPDQICVNQGIRSHGPEPIVCLPNQVSIRFSAAGSDGLDAVTGR